jgi:glycosyltransferase involved in cell wall biosynthesis
MKILQVNSALQFGGAETVASQLFAGCRAAGHESAMAVAEGKFFPRGAGVLPLYPRLLSRLHMSRFHRATERLFPRREWTDRALGRLAQSEWEIIHVHNFHGDYARLETLAAVAAQKPLVWTFHGCWGFTGGCDHTGGCDRYQQACGDCPQVGRWSFLARDDTAEQLQRKLRHFRGAAIHVVSPSRWLAEKIKGSQVGVQWNVRVIPNGVDTQRFNSARQADPGFRDSLGLAAEKTLVLVVNRNFQDQTKGFPLAAEAIQACRDEAIQVILVGQNSDWAAAQLDGVNVASMGYVSSLEKIAALYEAADILLFASPEENFPCTVLEAMAAGCCVVATPTGGVREQLQDRVTGFLAEAIDGDALAASLRTALEDPARRTSCAHAAREHAVADFSEAQMVRRYLEFYHELLKVRPCD